MSGLSESQIREYAKSCDLEKLHQQYQYTSKNSPELIDHNEYYYIEGWNGVILSLVIIIRTTKTP